MSTLDDILRTLRNIDYNTQIAVGMAWRLNAGYQSKECKESYQNAEKWALSDLKKIEQYPPHWVEAARLIRDLRQYS